MMNWKPVSEGHHFPQSMKWDSSGKLAEEEKTNRAGARDRTWVAIKILVTGILSSYTSSFVTEVQHTTCSTIHGSGFNFHITLGLVDLTLFKIQSDFYMWVFPLFFVLHVTCNSLNLFHIILCSCSGLIQLKFHLVYFCFMYLIYTLFCFKQTFIVSLVSDLTPLS